MPNRNTYPHCRCLISVSPTTLLSSLPRPPSMPLALGTCCIVTSIIACILTTRVRIQKKNMKLEIIVVSPEKNILKYFVISIICNNRFNVKKCMILGSSKPWAYSLMAGVLGFSFPRHFKTSLTSSLTSSSSSSSSTLTSSSLSLSQSQLLITCVAYF